MFNSYVKLPVGLSNGDLVTNRFAQESFGLTHVWTMIDIHGGFSTSNCYFTAGSAQHDSWWKRKMQVKVFLHGLNIK